MGIEGVEELNEREERTLVEAVLRDKRRAPIRVPAVHEQQALQKLELWKEKTKKDGGRVILFCKHRGRKRGTTRAGREAERGNKAKRNTKERGSMEEKGKEGEEGGGGGLTCESVVGSTCRLHSLLANDADANVRLLNHRDVVAAIANGQRAILHQQRSYDRLDTSSSSSGIPSCA